MSTRTARIPTTQIRRTFVSRLAVFALLVAGACGGGNGGGDSDDDGDGIAPSVSSTMPMSAAPAN